jgi:hypothetical protein
MADKDDFEVHGKVTGPEGQEVSGADVIVWLKRIRRLVQLGTGETSKDGQYRVRYEVPDDATHPVLIVVEARSPHLKAPIFSPMLEAQPDLLVNLSADTPDNSEWATLLAAIQPFLDGLKFSDLVENADLHDITFLSRELNRSTEDVMRVVVSSRLETAFGIPAPAFYAFVRQRVPSALPSPLLDASQNFTLIDALVHSIGSMIFALASDAQQHTLTAAIALNLIGPQYTSQIPQIVSQLQAHRSTDLINQPYLVGKATLGQLLEVAQIPAPKQQAFAQALATNSLSMRNFWRTLGDGKHGLTATEASTIERTLSVGAFVKNHPPLIQALLQGFTAGTYQTLHDLARLSVQDWVTLVNRTGPPPSINAAGAATPAEVFARVVYTRVTRAFPTAALSSRVAAGEFVPAPVRAPLHQFFLNLPALELIKENLPVYLAGQGDKAFTGIDEADRAPVLDQARKFQRVLRVAPHVDTAQTLLGLGIHSAAQIATMGEQQFFLKATQAGLTKPEANRIYRAGAQRYAASVSLFTQLNRDAIGIWPNAIGQTSDLSQPIQQAIQRDQSLATLFGSQDYCQVDSCTSILSPAAYLCDLLLWLRNHPQTGHTALSVLDGRRPDIRHLLLNCPNTNTPLPYIDLVNELLADAISPPLDPNSTINPIWKQTSANKTAAELRAAPEYFNQAAYVTLFGASYPHTLPYSAGLDELRTYLQQSGVPLWQLRQALLPLHSPSVAQRAAVAGERLGMAPHEVELVIVANDVTAAIAWNIANPAAAVAPVPAFLQAASITYESLLELLQVGWVQGESGISIQGINDTCDTTIQALSPAPLNAGFLDRAHRFLRLWRRTGYMMWELDLLLRSSVSDGSLDANALIALQSFWQLQSATGLAVDRLLAFYQDIDTSSHRDPDGSTGTSLYGRIFLNPAVTSVAPDPDLAALPSGGAIADTNLSHHLAAIQAALGVSGADAATLFGLTDNLLTLANLSLSYRVNALAKASKLSISDLIGVARLLTPAAGSAVAALAPLLASPAATLAFLGRAKAVQQSGFSIDALTYLLTLPPWATTTQMTDTDITAALTAVRNAILNPSGGDVKGSVIAAMAANAHRPADAPVAADVSKQVMQPLQVPGTGSTLLAVLTDPSLIAQMGGVFTPITRANFPNQFLAVQLFDKAAAIVRRLHLVLADLTWLMANAAVYGGLDFTQLPVANTQTALPLAPLLTTLQLVKLARLFTAAPPAATIQTLYDLIGGVNTGTLVNEAAAQAALATITGWPLPDTVAFASALGTVFPGDYETPALYDTMRTLEAIGAAAGATGAQMAALGAVPANEPAAETLAAAALGALKAKFPNNNDWLALAPKLMDPIRERRSAALQAYLIGQRDMGGNLIYGDTNGLFDHFLIDVQMTSCQVTTRVIQAYIAVQIFVERCLMNLEAPQVVADLTRDDTWNQWEWMKRYRIWQANREVFLYPENWLIESQRPNRTETYTKLEQEVHQGDSTKDYLETVVLGYVDRLDGLAHLSVTGTCEDSVTGAIHVVARSLADPPVFYLRSFDGGAWTGWTQIPLDIKAHQVVPAVYRGRICLFWPQVKISTEPHQNVPPPQPSSAPPSQEVSRFATLEMFFTIFRNGVWAPAQAAKGKLFDKPPIDSNSVSDSKSIEAIYTVKVQTATSSGGLGASLLVDVFRLGQYNVWAIPGSLPVVVSADESTAVHLGRAVFDGRFNDLELRNMVVPNQSIFGTPFFIGVELLEHAQQTYGPDAQLLLPLPANQADPNLASEPGLVPKAGALATGRPDPKGGANQTIALNFTSAGALEQNVGPLLNAAPVPFRVVGPVTNLNFDPSSYFFFQDNRRSYYVESQKYYWTGSTWSPVVPSNPGSVPFEVRYVFHRFYHPFTRLFWHQLSSGGFPLLYDRNLQLNPDQIDPSGADMFQFQSYQPVQSRVRWDHDDVTGQDREFLDFRYNASFSVYNWELFFHIPLYIAELLSQNQKFEDALKWFHYIFDPTRPGADPAPKRFWIPKPLYDLTSAEILAERINNLLVAVNNGDPNAIAQVTSWRRDPFNPFLLADQRPVAYMKRTVMSYLDNLIHWADNLFATQSREALSEATLLYVIAAEILGPRPAAITPPQHADESYDQLEPRLDAFANAMVDIENAIGGAGGGGGGGDGGGMPHPQTFYFKIPPNDKLLGYWTTVGDRLFKLRHCQNIQGQELQLALFDAPIDPGLLIKARAAGVDIGSVLTDLTAALPNYRFTALYPQALDFVNAVRAYGALLLSALEKSDADQLAVLTATNQQELLQAADQIFEWQVEQAQNAIDALQKAADLASERVAYYNGQGFMNAAEYIALGLQTTAIVLNAIAGFAHGTAAVAHAFPDITVGVQGFGGTAVAIVKEGGSHAGQAAGEGGKTLTTLAAIAEKAGGLSKTLGDAWHRHDDWSQKATEAQFDFDRTNVQIDGARLALKIAQQNQANHQTQVDQLQKQIDFLTGKFSNQELYDWMAAQLAETYFQSYKLAYRLCKQVERCYRFEIGIQDSSFIQFGYWDSLHKGLLAGETLNHDLRRMQASYLDENRRRFEISRFVSLGALNPPALQQLLVTGACNFDLPESLFDTDYPGHYNRHLLRVSITVVYPNPGKFDNVKATLTMVSNKVRVSTDTGPGYPENPVGTDTRFLYNYAAAPQKIVLGNAQDDPGLFLTSISNNLSDQRYLPFENAGAISSWHFEMPQANNEIDVSAVGDVVLHLYYTAVDGGGAFQAAVQANNLANLPTSGVKVFSAQNDFSAPAATVANPYPVSPWQSFLAAPPPATDQTLTLGISPGKFPPWTRGKTIAVTGIVVLAVSWNAGNFVLEPQAPLPGADLVMTPVAGVTEPNVCGATVTPPPNTPPGSWTFKLRKQSAGDFRSLSRNDLGDVLLLVSFTVS